MTSAGRPVRNVDLLPDLLEDFRRYVAGLPDQEPERLLFPSAAGTPLDPKNVVDRIFKTALTRAGLRSLRWHDLRHTFASLQLAAEANIKYLSQQLGHADVGITLNRYSHLLQDSHPAQAAKLSSLVFARPLGFQKPIPIEHTKGSADGAAPANNLLMERSATGKNYQKDDVT